MLPPGKTKFARRKLFGYNGIIKKWEVIFCERVLLANNYPIQCSCGASIIVEVDSQCSHLQVYCAKCRTLLFSKTNSNEANEKINKAEVSPQDKALPAEKVQKFAEYTVLKQLGAGSTGRVYLAIDDITHEKVAIKILRKHNDSRSIDYFIRETQVLMNLEHENIVTLKKWGNYQGFPFFTMEYIEGYTLSKFLKKGSVSIKHAARIIVSVLDALEYAHQFRIVHRDIKPGNIILAKSRVIKVLDFGVGKILEDGGGLTETGQMIGTGFYMPPEQFQDAKRVDLTADIYATGATLYHALAGIPPFGEHHRNMTGLLKSKIGNDYISLAERSPHLSPEIIQIVEKAMAHEKSKRYQSAQEMREILFPFSEMKKSL